MSDDELADGYQVDLATAQACLPELFRRADDNGPIEVHDDAGELLGVLVAPGSWGVYCQLEDAHDNRVMDAARQEPGESIPWSQVKAELNL